MLSRRVFVFAAASAAASPAIAAAAPVVTVLGDSITAGLGLRAADALPAQLQAALAKLHVGAIVSGAGVSGDIPCAINFAASAGKVRLPM